MPGEITTIEFSHDNRKLLVGVGTHSANQIWDIKNKELLYTLPGQASAFSPDSRKIFIYKEQATSVYDSQSGTLLKTLNGFPWSFSQDNSFLKIKDNDHTTSRVLDANTYKELVTLKDLDKNSLTKFSFDNSKLIEPSINKVKIFDLAGRIIKEYFSNKDLHELTLQKQALLITLDSLSKQKMGESITHADLVESEAFDFTLIFNKLPVHVINALKSYYNLADDIIKR